MLYLALSVFLSDYSFLTLIARYTQDDLIIPWLGGVSQTVHGANAPAFHDICGDAWAFHEHIDHQIILDIEREEQKSIERDFERAEQEFHRAEHCGSRWPWTSRQ